MNLNLPHKSYLKNKSIFYFRDFFFFEILHMDIDRHLATILDGGCLAERDLKLVCERAKEIFLEESNV